MRVLVAIDDHSAASALANVLVQCGNEVQTAHNAQAARAALTHMPPASAVLDYAGLDGACADLLELCRRVPSNPATLVLCTPAHLNQLFDGKVQPHEYALMPPNTDTVAVRLQALMRGERGNLHRCVRASGLVLDPQARAVFHLGQLVQLPPKEFDLLHLLMSRAGEIVTREEAGEWLYRWGQDIESNALDVHVHALRRRFWHALIRTVRGQGHVLMEVPREPGGVAVDGVAPQQPS